MSRTSIKPPASPSEAPVSSALDFTALVEAIANFDENLAKHAARIVNVSLTLRNWLIGYYIREYEQRGADRAKYGEGLINSLAGALSNAGHADMAPRSLRLYRQFFIVYPGIWQSLSAKSGLLGSDALIWQSLIANSPVFVQEPLSNLDKREAVSTELTIPPAKLLTSLSFSHFAELIGIEDSLKRTYYDIDCLWGNWSVRPLKRQISTHYFERSGLSEDKFLGLKSQEIMHESDLEASLVTNLREFLLELGHGFCLEAQQKSITIGNTRGFVDLVFYHRILKCHVLVELKVDEFTHENIGQLNAYVMWYRKHMKTEGDNPPVGLLLCTDKDHALVEYATASMSNRLFVSKYQLELPKKEELERFLQEKRREISAELT